MSLPDQLRDDHADHHYADRDDDPCKRSGPAKKSHIKLSFIARVTCDTHGGYYQPKHRPFCIYNLYQLTPGPEKVNMTVTQM